MTVIILESNSGVRQECHFLSFLGFFDDWAEVFFDLAFGEAEAFDEPAVLELIEDAPAASEGRVVFDGLDASGGFDADFLVCLTPAPDLAAAGVADCWPRFDDFLSLPLDFATHAISDRVYVLLWGRTYHKSNDRTECYRLLRR